MVNWNAVVMAMMRAEGQWWTSFTEAMLRRDLTWSEMPPLLSAEAEQLIAAMLDEWRTAGVEQPIALYATVESVSAAVYVVALMRAPGPTLKVTAIGSVLGLAYGLRNALARRQERGPRIVSEPPSPR